MEKLDFKPEVPNHSEGFAWSAISSCGQLYARVHKVNGGFWVWRLDPVASGSRDEREGENGAQAACEQALQLFREFQEKIRALCPPELDPTQRMLARFRKP
jgi:hypothetical protein